MLEEAIAYLSKQSNEAIYKFDDILADLLFELDGKEYAKNLGESAYINDDTYFSPDSFLYARCVIIANDEAFIL